MRFFHSWQKIPPAYQNAVVAIGNFDGFHKGHRAVVEQAVEIARRENRPVVLMTFEPHPSGFFRPGGRTFRITPIRSKVRAICQLPIDGFFVFNFNRTFADMSADDFVENVLINGLHAAHIVVGEDYGFGKNRQGDAAYMRKKYPDLPVTTVKKLRDQNGEIISSSRIRAFLRDGEIEKATGLMEHPFEMEGYVIHGSQLGRKIGFPTINIIPGDSILPRIGVYAACVNIDGKDFRAIANIGFRPTVNGQGVLLEAHILNFDGDLYGQRLRVRLQTFIRPEVRFGSIEELKTQIMKDSEIAERISR
ncbi:MAG: bifunctional riboflavin kinase/FAD synthetase [Alphaproteobacteria bacterium]|nr:bifunctional riboflavin kinase/FAD synthetase [Alphaproteobacteria bacterium]MBO4644249.1 bifunctional riboflavin kinase/FAD synthetase [Alphaproteobacteria bacterium]